MTCDTCQANEAKFMIGNLENGDQLAVCPPCAGRWGVTMAKIMLPAEEVAELVGPLFVRPAETSPEAPAEATKIDKAAARNQKRAKAARATGGAPEVAATATDERD